MSDEEDIGKKAGDKPEEPASPKLGKLPESLLVVLLLFPGFLSERVSAYLSTAPAVNDLQLVASALAATLFNIVVAVVITAAIPGKRTRAARTPLIFQLRFLVVVFLVSVASGVIWASLDSRNVIFRLHLTDRASRADPWETVFQSNASRDRPDYVRVMTKSVGTYHGLPLYYPQTGTDRALVLDMAQRELGTSPADGEAAKRRSGPLQCEPVGIGVRGRVLIASDQILAVEFRPKTDVGGRCEYRCDMGPTAQPCGNVPK